MANEQNLIPGGHRLTKEEQSAGGRKSGETRRRRKAFAEAFNVLLEREFTDHNGNKLQGIDAVSAQVFKAAMDGDIRATQFIRDTVGEMPVQKVETVEISQETYERVARALEED